MRGGVPGAAQGSGSSSDKRCSVVQELAEGLLNPFDCFFYMSFEAYLYKLLVRDVVDLIFLQAGV